MGCHEEAVPLDIDDPGEELPSRSGWTPLLSQAEDLTGTPWEPQGAPGSKPPRERMSSSTSRRAGARLNWVLSPSRHPTNQQLLTLSSPKHISKQMTAARGTFSSTTRNEFPPVRHFEPSFLGGKVVLPSGGVYQMTSLRSFLQRIRSKS